VLEYTVFSLLGLFALLGGGMILLGRQPATFAMGFLIVLLALSGLFALLHQSFLFFAQLMVTVGGVVVVTLIAIMTVNLRPDRLPEEPLDTGDRDRAAAGSFWLAALSGADRVGGAVPSRAGDLRYGPLRRAGAFR